MSRKFTIKVAGCEWTEGDDIETLLMLDREVASAIRQSDGRFLSVILRRTNKYRKHKTMSAAKACVIKQLAGDGKESK